jgi:hypothetical protein
MVSRALGRRIRDTLGPVFSPLYFCYLLMEDRRSARFFPRWIRSFGLSRDSVGNGLPWLPFELIEWLDLYLKRDMSVFEFGSGGSTIFMAPRVKTLISVEHNPAWHGRVSAELEKRALNNVTYLLREPIASGATPPAEYWDNYGSDYANMSFERYVKAIDDYPDRSFDLVLVDGRSRKGCLERAIGKTRPGGYIVMDNSSTPEYLGFYRPLEGFPRWDITSIAPFWPPAKWQATRWQI